MTERSAISSQRVWLLAIRPRTLPASVSPVVVGIALAMADRVFAPLPALAALIGSVLIQIGANLANDYFDYVKGADSDGRQGPLRVAQSGLISLPRLRLGIVLSLALAAVIGIYLVTVGGWVILVIGLASILSALVYSGGPFPVGYHGLGDLFVFLFFGLAAVSGTYYVQALTITAPVVLAAVPVGLLTVAILVVNNIRDLDTDRTAGKETLAVRIGLRRTQLEYGLLMAVSYAVPLMFWIAGWSSIWVMLPWLTIPLAWRLVRTVHQTSAGPALNRALAGTANLDLVFSLMFALGLVV